MGEDLDTPQKRLKYFIINKFKTAVAFSNALGVHPTYTAKYTKNSGSIFKSSEIHSKLYNIGLNVDWYLTGDGEMITSEQREKEVKEVLNNDGMIEVLHQDFIEIPMVQSAFPCGFPCENEGDILTMPVLKLLVEGLKNPYILRCKGDSMSPKILDGDFVIAETISGDMSRVKDGDIVVAYVNREFTIKRIFSNAIGFILSPENQEHFKPYFLTKDDEAMIIAIVRRRLTGA